MLGHQVIDFGKRVRGEPVISQVQAHMRTTLTSGRTAFRFDGEVYLSYQGVWYSLTQLPRELQIGASRDVGSK